VTKQGAFLYQKKGIPHTYKNIGKNVRRLLFTIIPAGFENFFAEVGILLLKTLLNSSGIRSGPLPGNFLLRVII
jgi:hypothetical protein